MEEPMLPIDINSGPDLSTLVATVRRTQQPLSLTDGVEAVAVLMPAKPARRRRRKGHPISADDPIWEIVGMVESDGPGDVTENHDRYLADAYLNTHETHE